MISANVEYPFTEPGKLQQWRYSVGDKFDKGSIIGIFNSSKNQSELNLISQYDGIIKSILINDTKKELNKGYDNIFFFCKYKYIIISSVF